MVALYFIGNMNKPKGAPVYELSQNVIARCCMKVFPQGTILSWPPTRRLPSLKCYSCFKKDDSHPKKKNCGKQMTVQEGYYVKVSRIYVKVSP